MKITLKIFRVIFKLLLLVYVMGINFCLISVFYFLLLGIVKFIFPAFLPHLFTEYGIARHFVYSMPLYIVLLYMLYYLSPLNVWRMRVKEGFKKLNENDKERVNRLLLEMGMDRKLNVYRNKDPRMNAAAFGFNTVGLTDGLMRTASDEELKGVISHEVGHISHYDYVYQILLFSMESLGYRCLYGIFLIPSLIFGFIGSLISTLIPIGSLVGLMGKIWFGLYKLLHHTIYGISRLVDVNINKYGEYRCDTYAVKYGCGYGLLSFLHKLTDVDSCGERPSFTEYIMSTHPSTEKRIARLKKLL